MCRCDRWITHISRATDGVRTCGQTCGSIRMRPRSDQRSWQRGSYLSGVTGVSMPRTSATAQATAWASLPSVSTR